MMHWALFSPSDSDSFSAPLNVHILTLTLLLPQVVVLHHPAGFLGVAGVAGVVLPVASWTYLEERF